VPKIIKKLKKNSKPWNFEKKIISHIYIFLKELLEISEFVDKISNPYNKTLQKIS